MFTKIKFLSQYLYYEHKYHLHDLSHCLSEYSNFKVLPKKFLSLLAINFNLLYHLPLKYTFWHTDDSR